MKLINRRLVFSPNKPVYLAISDSEEKREAFLKWLSTITIPPFDEWLMFCNSAITQPSFEAWEMNNNSENELYGVFI